MTGHFLALHCATKCPLGVSQRNEVPARRQTTFETCRTFFSPTKRFCTLLAIIVSATLAAIQNDQMAKHVAAHPDRFMAIATLPLAQPARAAA